MATYAIGDIQGCFEALLHLLGKCQFDRRKDQLWLVGDLVNRGPQSLEVLRFVKKLGKSAITVLGNHDLHLLMLAEDCVKPSHDDTLDEILSASDRDELLTWLRHQPLLHVSSNTAMVHAGLLPQWSISNALALAGEVETALRGDNYRKFLAHMRGSEPKSWQDDLTGWSRLRVIVNAMTRLRFCSIQGEMEFRSKGGVGSAPPGYMPWFEVPQRQSTGSLMVTGHWSALGLRLTDELLALDSGCFWGGQLSAVRLEDRAVFQVEGQNSTLAPNNAING